MNEREKNQEYTISVVQILKILKKYLIPILIITIVAGAAAYVISAKFIKPKYRAEAMIYVSAKDYMQSGQVTTSDLSIAKQLVNTYAIILKTDNVLNEVCESLGNQITAAKIRANLSAASVNNTEVFTVSYVDRGSQRDCGHRPGKDNRGRQSRRRVRDLASEDADQPDLPEQDEERRDSRACRACVIRCGIHTHFPARHEDPHDRRPYGIVRLSRSRLHTHDNRRHSRGGDSGG